MTTKSILLAAQDTQVLVDVAEALGEGWESISVSTETEVVAQLEQRGFDAFLVDFNLGSSDASEVLNLAAEKRPGTVRFLLAHEADLALVAAKVNGLPHILPKPIEPAAVRCRIETGVADSQPDPSETPQANGFSETLEIPSVYAEVLKALESPGVTSKQVAEIIARDQELTFELLELTNSAYLGLPRDITDPTEAVQSLGLDTVKALVMARQFLAERQGLKPGYLSLEDIWQHSVQVGRIARDLVLFETKDRVRASQALAAGLLHDLGKIVLATNFDDLYGRVYSLARKQPVALWDVEKEMFGANHGEIGACLVGMWNMPGPIVDATALHHEPPLGEQDQLTPLAAVHIANVLAHQVRPGNEPALVPPVISTPFLNELGLLPRLPVWHAVFAKQGSESAGAGIELAQTGQPGAPLTAGTSSVSSADYSQTPASATRTTTAGSPQAANGPVAVQAARYRNRWIYGSIAVAVVAVVALLLNLEPEFNQTEAVYARTPSSHEASTPAPAPFEVELIPWATAQAVPAADVSKEFARPAAPVVASKDPPAPPKQSDPKVAATVSPATNPPVVTAAPTVKARPEYRLNGIIYSSARPSAIVNGKTVGVGEQVNDATILEIGPTTVTLRVKGERKTLELQ
jgi:HD-like signal output (HDOD) protein